MTKSKARGQDKTLFRNISQFIKCFLVYPIGIIKL